ncbi:hypothetical protein ACQV9O_26640, partial [Ralstonia pseudosolanacearum]|uniref:hypothetical protein n=1 Tax=Ralstonia pseudosolanacearum TaxID=1310165 RepID=UPI003D2B35A6
MDFYLPLLGCAVSLILIATFRPAFNTWGSGGLIEGLQGVIQSLPGFYIAALAAISTFGKQTTLDMVMPKPTPVIKTRFGSGMVPIELTRRRFLCLLFSHLTAVSIILSLSGPFLRTSAPVLKQYLDPLAASVAFYAVAGIYLFLLFQMFFVTLLGLYYLSDKIHQPDPTPSDE